MSHFVERLKELVLEHNLRGYTLAQAIGVAPTSVSRFLLGKRMPNYNTFINILYLFNCSADYLLGLEEFHTSEPLHEVLPFGSQLRSLMKKQKITQQKIIEDLSLSSNAVYKWLSGKSLPSPDSLIRIAEYLDCSVDYLIGRRR